MSKTIEAYKGDDARKIKCIEDYTVQDGHEGTAEATVYQKGRTYSVHPATFLHMIRKVDHFIDPDQAKRLAAEEADKADAAAAQDGRAGAGQGAAPVKK